ncbi:hypothetical protein E4P82_10950 [Candidatus Competibacter phosphatis]|uniref:Uncharacterized protein n=1 Tax=Candidatus Competibacter phosphatis TaxID=221280 RepID=A0ABX1TMK3_9GAMM|nr:hypothetical protein [Candidatus Competibacter phosphatis]NMQ19670.1 hypothetical protein [Candidatus Competibacter phosphatis]
MEAQYRLRKQTPHAIYDVQMQATQKAAPEFKLTIYGLDHLEDADRSRYSDAIRTGVQKAIDLISGRKNIEIDLTVRELSGETPPFGYEQCARILVEKFYRDSAT